MRSLSPSSIFQYAALLHYFQLAFLLHERNYFQILHHKIFHPKILIFLYLIFFLFWIHHNIHHHDLLERLNRQKDHLKMCHCKNKFIFFLHIFAFSILIFLLFFYLQNIPLQKSTISFFIFQYHVAYCCVVNLHKVFLFKKLLHSLNHLFSFFRRNNLH